MKPVELTAEAELDAFEIAHHYERELEGLGVRFESDLDWTLTRIEENPLQFPIVSGAIRRALLGQFPYGVFFSDEPNAVIVAAVLHLHQRRATWKR
jgi:plasmid stabilization system protein ParE